MPSQREHKSHWREDGTCSYCGSMSPEKLFQAIEAGCVVDGTDKNYKLYVHVEHPEAGQPCILSSANFTQKGEGWVQITPENRASLPLSDWRKENWEDGHWVLVEPRPRMHTEKFYFQQFTVADRDRFILLYNEGKINFSKFGLYVMPYFCVMSPDP